MTLCHLNDPLDQKCCLCSQPIPRSGASSGLCTSHLKQGRLCGPSQLGAFYFFSLVLYYFFLSCTSFLTSISFCSSSSGDCLLHKVLNRVGITEIVFFNHVLTHLFQTTLCFEITIISDL